MRWPLPPPPARRAWPASEGGPSKQDVSLRPIIHCWEVQVFFLRFPGHQVVGSVTGLVPRPGPGKAASPPGPGASRTWQPRPCCSERNQKLKARLGQGFVTAALRPDSVESFPPFSRFPNYLCGSLSYRERGRERGLPSVDSLSRCPHLQRLGQAEARTLELHRCLPSTQAIFCIFPRHTSRKLDLKWSS